MRIEPPRHLSEEARSRLLNLPQPATEFDAADPAAVRQLREVLHAEWLAVNDDIPGRW